MGIYVQKGCELDGSWAQSSEKLQTIESF